MEETCLEIKVDRCLRRHCNAECKQRQRQRNDDAARHACLIGKEGDREREKENEKRATTAVRFQTELMKTIKFL